MATYGIKISRDGYNVTDSSVAESNLVYSSEYIYPKIAKITSITGDAPNTVSEAHGMGYAPMYMFFEEIAAGEWAIDDCNYFDPTASVWVDATNIYYLGSDSVWVVIFVDRIDG